MISGEVSSGVVFEERESAFKKRLSTFAVVNLNHIDLNDFLGDAFLHFEEQIINSLQRMHMIKVSACLSTEFEKSVETENGTSSEKQTIYIHTKGQSINSNTDLKDHYNSTVVDFILKQFDDVVMKGSGFKLSTINELVVEVNKYEPLGGSTYIKLPKFLIDKRAIINVKNDDDQCFKWAVLSALYPTANHPERLNNYLRYANELNFTGIEFPMKINKIGKFENLNVNISINLYHFDSKAKTVYPLYLTKAIKRNHIHLLWITEKDADECNKSIEQNAFNTSRKAHFCWIKNLSRLINSQISKNNRRSFFCDRCLNHFRELHKYEIHIVDCMKQNKSALELPNTQNNKIKFSSITNKLKAPFIIYADVEALLKTPTQEFSKSSSTTAEQEHEVFSVGYYFHCAYDNSKSFYKSHRGLNCIDWFVGELKDIAQFVKPILDTVVPMNITPENEINFQESKTCHICCGVFTTSDLKVRDHSHLTGDYRGAAHSNCNLLFRESREIPVVFHNLSGYDAHFLITKLATGFEGYLS